MTPSPLTTLLFFLFLFFFVESLLQGRILSLAVWAYNGSVRRDPEQQVPLLGRYQALGIAFLGNFVGLGAAWFYKLILVSKDPFRPLDIDEAMNTPLDSWGRFTRQFFDYEALFRLFFVLFVTMAMLKILLDTGYSQAIRITLNYVALLVGLFFAIMALFGLPERAIELMAWLFPS